LEVRARKGVPHDTRKTLRFCTSVSRSSSLIRERNARVGAQYLPYLMQLIHQWARNAVECFSVIKEQMHDGRDDHSRLRGQFQQEFLATLENARFR
jgi:hypothetical protein